MKRLKLYLLIGYISMVGLAFFQTKQVYAQAAIDLSVTPPTAFIKIKPGSSATHTITIENSGNQQLKIQPKIVDFSSDNHSGTPSLSDRTTFPYFEFDAQSLEPLTIAAKGKAQLSLKFSVPSGAPDKEYPLTVLFETQPDDSFALTANTSLVRGTIGSNLIVLVSSEATVATSLDITSFKIGHIIDSFRPLHFTPVVTNTGYAAAPASGSAHITNWQGKKVAEFKIKPVVILGNSSRELENETSDGSIAPFNYKSLFLIGFYTIHVELQTITQDQPVQISQTKTVLTLPISLLIAGITIPAAWLLYKYFLHNK